MTLTIGIDIGGTKLRAARVTASGVIEAARSERVDRDPERLMERLLDFIRELDAPGVDGIGIGVPGRVDYAARVVLSGGFVDLSTVDLVAGIERPTGRPVVIDNDATMALIAEAAIGGAAGARHVVLLTLGTGVGGAILEDGRIVRGRRGAGQLGHMVVVPDGSPCVCGRRGCLETVVSGTALNQVLIAAGFDPATDIATVLARAADADAQALIKGWAGPLRQALDSLASLFDPEVILLGGGLGRAATDALASTEATSPWYPYAVAAATLGDEAGVIGAALAARERIVSGSRD